MALQRLQERPAVEDAEQRLGSMLKELNSQVVQCLTSISEKIGPHQLSIRMNSPVLISEASTGKGFDTLLQELYERIADCSQRISECVATPATQSTCPVPSTNAFGHAVLEQPIACAVKSGDVSS